MVLLSQTRTMSPSLGGWISPGNIWPAKVTDLAMARSGAISALVFAAMLLAVLFRRRSPTRWISRIRTFRAALSARRRYSTTW
ncbi:hypothetical protein D3C87_2030080 [compost metagenome]